MSPADPVYVAPHSMDIRVAHVVPALFDAQDGILGGAERYAFELARHMANHVPTALVTFGITPRQESTDRLQITVLGGPWYIRGQKSNPFHRYLITEIRRASVIHCHQQHVLYSSIAAAFCRMTGRKVFVSDLGGGGWDLSAFFSTDNWFHGHLHLSEFSKKVFGHSNRPSAHVISGGVDTEKFSPSFQVHRNGMVLFVGRILPHKGIEHLIQAVDENTGVEIVGEHYHQKYLKDLNLLARGKNISFVGSCTEAELVTKYRKSLCVVLPSVYRTLYGENILLPELLGQTVLESMSCGTPVICTEVGALPELVIDGVTGFLVPPNDPSRIKERLQWLSRNPEKASEMGRAAREHVLKHFQWSSVVERCLKIYQGDHG